LGTAGTEQTFEKAERNWHDGKMKWQWSTMNCMNDDNIDVLVILFSIIHTQTG